MKGENNQRLTRSERLKVETFKNLNDSKPTHPEKLELNRSQSLLLKVMKDRKKASQGKNDKKPKPNCTEIDKLSDNQKVALIAFKNFKEKNKLSEVETAEAMQRVAKRMQEDPEFKKKVETIAANKKIPDGIQDSIGHKFTGDWFSIKSLFIISAIGLICYLNFWLSELTTISPEHWKNILTYTFFSFISLFCVVLLFGKNKKKVLHPFYFSVLVFTSVLIYAEYLNYDLWGTVDSMNIFKLQGIIAGISLAYILIFESIRAKETLKKNDKT